ncbi:MAG: hypothetical protein U5K70_00675 [Halodesulfurarchaeum sp.]|nr:hypothetical protein [Halodesulfurarchaeum sp.]
MAGTIQLNEDEGCVEIQNLTIEDSDVFRYLQDVEPEGREAEVRSMLAMGVVALRASQTAGEIDYVERRFSELQYNLEGKFEDTFGEEGHIREYLEGQIGEDGRLVDELLNPNEPDSPMYRLKKAISDEFDELEKNIFGEEVREGMVEKTPLKGGKFEEELEDLLGEVAKIHGDKLTFTGEEHGELESSKKGDFVVDLGRPKGRIAVEAKNMSYNLPDIESEMKEAIRNREADYGLFVARSIDQLPNKVGWFNEYDGEYLVVALSEGDEAESADELLKVAYRWSRMRLLEELTPTGEDIDVSEIQSKVKAAERTMEDFRNIRTKLTNIEKSSQSIRDILGEIESDLDEQLRAINSEIEANV